MDTITEPQLRKLIQSGVAPCVSIFLPTHTSGRDVRQDPPRLKNLLRQAEAELTDVVGMRGTEARDLLEPARRLLDDTDFWSGNSSGLAIYICPEFHRVLRLPVEVEDMAVVNDSFEVKPLLPLLQGNLFYVLALSDNSCRLLECTPTTCNVVKMPEDVAMNLKDTAPDEDEHQTRTHFHDTNTYAHPNASAGSFHGGAADLQGDRREDLMFFYRQLEDGVLRVVADEEAPLVIAGVDSRAPHYINGSKHRSIQSEWIHGNPEHVPNETLHEKAMAILQPSWAESLDKLMNQFGQAISHEQGSNDVSDIVPASMQGRVDTLFVAPRTTVWGRFHEDDQRVEIHEEHQEGDIDLIDRAVTQSLMNGARVVVLDDPEEMPGNREIAASGAGAYGRIVSPEAADS